MAEGRSAILTTGIDGARSDDDAAVEDEAAAEAIVTVDGRYDALSI